MEKVVEKIAEIQFLIEGLNQEIQETKDLQNQLRLISRKVEYEAMLKNFRKIIRIKNYELAGKD